MVEKKEPQLGLWSSFAKHFREASAEFREDAVENHTAGLDYVGLGQCTYALYTAIRQTHQDRKSRKPPAPQ